jgi:hypothetical protein
LLIPDVGRRLQLVLYATRVDDSSEPPRARPRYTQQSPASARLDSSRREADGLFDHFLRRTLRGTTRRHAAGNSHDVENTRLSVEESRATWHPVKDKVLIRLGGMVSDTGNNSRPTMSLMHTDGEDAEISLGGE